MYRIFSKDFILPNLLVLPMVSQWLLPEGLERMLRLDILGIMFYFPNVLYFVYYSKHKSLYLNGIPFCYNKFVEVFVTFGIACLLFHTVINADDIVTAINLVLNNYFFVFVPLLLFYKPLSYTEIDKTKYVLVFALIVLSLEIILYSTGILSYTSATGDNLSDGRYETGGIFRVSTTVGGATGTAIILVMLGALLLSFYNFKNEIKLGLTLLTTIAVFFTISRGSITVWSIFLLIYFTKNYFLNTPFTKKILYISLFGFSLMGLNNYGVFDPVIERQTMLTEADNLSTGRDERAEKALQIFDESNYLGVGSGKVIPDKSLYEKVQLYYDFSPHNIYLLILAELGIIGIILIAFIYLPIIVNLDYSKSHAILVPIMMVITFNSEVVPLFQEYIPLFVILLLSSYKYNSY